MRHAPLIKAALCFGVFGLSGPAMSLWDQNEFRCDEDVQWRSDVRVSSGESGLPFSRFEKPRSSGLGPADESLTGLFFESVLGIKPESIGFKTVERGQERKAGSFPGDCDSRSMIQPSSPKSKWSIILCLVFGSLSVWLMFALLSRQLTSRLRLKFEQHLTAREQMAKELYDALLQSMQGLVLHFQSVAERLPANEPARDQLEAALARADDVIIEGRNRVQYLRIGDEANVMLSKGLAFDDFKPNFIVRWIRAFRSRNGNE